MSYGITYLDMYDYGDSWSGPEFGSAEDALDHAKSVLNDFLQRTFVPGMTAAELYDQFMTFGEDVMILPMNGEPSLNFRGQEYVRQRSAELCAAVTPSPVGATEATAKSPAVSAAVVDCVPLPPDVGRAEAQVLKAKAAFSQMVLWPPALLNYPPNTKFFEVDGVAVLKSPLGFCRAADGSFCSMEMISERGTPLSEHEFEALASKAFRSIL